MVIVEHIGHSRSVEYRNKKTGESMWIRFETKVSFSEREGDNYKDAVDTAIMVVNDAFKSGVQEEIEEIQSKSEFETSRPKMKPDASIMKRYLLAVETGDEKTIAMLSTIYDIKTEE